MARLSESNWEELLASVRGSGFTNGFRQVKEAALCVGQKVLVAKVLTHPSFKLASGYIYADDEVAGVADQVLQEVGNDSLRLSVIERVKQHCSLAHQIRARLEHYQGLNADPVVRADNKRHIGPIQSLVRYGKSLSVSLRGGPALSSTARDLVIILILAALASTYIAVPTVLETSKFGRFFSRNELVMKGLVVVLNFLLLSAAVYLVYRGVKT